MDRVAEAVIVKVERITVGAWGDDAALALVFELPDGRQTAPTLIPGNWQVQELIKMVDVATPGDLVGQRLQVRLADPSVDAPTVVELLGSAVPDSFRRAFEEKSDSSP